VEVCSFLLDFTGICRQEFALKFRGNFGFGFLTNVGTVKIIGACANRLAAFFIMGWI
jgi:hypothetical protein